VLEAEVLAQLQQAAEVCPLTPAQVRERLPAGPDGEELAYSTVVTVLSRLYEKGLLARVRQGRAYAYTPVADRHGLTARRMHRMMDADPDREAVLSRFVDDLSARDEDLLRRLLGGPEAPGEGG
jgi:predicted transcriptional regulator